MLVIREPEFRKLCNDAEQRYPEEACGILLGRRDQQRRTVAEVIPCRNTHAEPRTRYTLDPLDIIEAQKNGRERELDIVGFYHSHPDKAPLCSERDKSEAFWENCSYVIASVEQGQFRSARSYNVNIDSIEKLIEEPIFVSQTKREAEQSAAKD